MTSSLTFLIIVALSALTVAGDYFLKLASVQVRSFGTIWFYLGCGTYAITAFGWVFVLRHTKLAALGALYSLIVIILLALVGYFCFDERLSARELAGLAFACAAIGLLSRFN